MLNEEIYADLPTLNHALAKAIATIIKEAIQERGCAYIALSGGKTPLPMLQILSQYSLAWDKVTITLVDERWVDEENTDSNAALLKKSLFQNQAKEATFIPLKNAAPTPHKGQIECEHALSTLSNQLDLIVLGMGEDGHTASLFPKSPELISAMTTLSRCAAINPQTAPHLRMTLSASYLAQSRHVFLHITGLRKKALLNDWLKIDAPEPHAIIRQVVDLIPIEKTLFWSN